MPTDELASPPKSTLAGKLLALAGVLVSCAYLANLTFGGVIPLEIPDALPIVGNLDEAFFSGLLFVCLAKLGINVIPGLGTSRPPRIAPP